MLWFLFLLVFVFYLLYSQLIANNLEFYLLLRKQKKCKQFAKYITYLLQKISIAIHWIRNTKVVKKAWKSVSILVFNFCKMLLVPQNYCAENVQLRMGNTFFAFVTQHTRVCIVKFFFASKYKNFFGWYLNHVQKRMP